MLPSYRAGQSFPQTKQRHVKITAGTHSSNIPHAVSTEPSKLYITAGSSQTFLQKQQISNARSPHCQNVND